MLNLDFMSLKHNITQRSIQIGFLIHLFSKIFKYMSFDSVNSVLLIHYLIQNCKIS